MRLGWLAKLVVMVSLVYPVIGFTQPADTVRVCTYNVLNFGGSSSADSVRSLLFRKTLQAIDADVFVLGEITAAPALPRIRNQALNVFGITDWEYAPFIDGYDTDAGLFYRSSRLQFIAQDTLCTELRNINIYKLRPIGDDSTSNFYLFMMHLKASSGSTNEAQRAREASNVRNYANALPANSYFLYCGDMNLYSSSEAAYSVFTGSQTDNDGRAFDPLPAGNWNNNASFASIHTQSPRVRQFEGGSTGGMDDRFDFLLPSLALNNATGTRYLTGTMTAFGNDGNHFNDSINSRPNTAVPDSIADALHYGSDHIPVYADFLFMRPGSITLLRPNGGEELLVNRPDTIRWSSSGITGNIRIELNRNYPIGTWETLFANTANDGIEIWNPTAPVSSNARIRVVSVTNSVFADTSLSAFTIQPIPVLYQSATSVVFSARKPRTTDSTTLVIANASNIAFRYLALTGANGGAFSRTVLDNDSITPANDSLRIRIRFTPDSILTYRDTLQITFESPYQAVAIPLSGAGVGYYLSLSESALVYPNLLVTNTRDSLSTVLRLLGNAPITTGHVITLSGPFTASSSLLPTIQPGDSLTLQLFYQPNQQGNHNGEIAIISDAVNEDTLRIALSGRASDVPRAPANFTATKSGISIQLQWSRVDTSTLGNPIVVDGYTLLYRHSISSMWEPLEYFLHPDSTSYLHYGAANSGSGFYSVVAWIEQPNPEVNRLRLTPGMILLLPEPIPPNR